MSSSHNIVITPQVKAQIQETLDNLLINPPPYSIIGISLIIHGAKVKRIKTTMEIQTEVTE